MENTTHPEDELTPSDADNLSEGGAENADTVEVEPEDPEGSNVDTEAGGSGEEAGSELDEGETEAGEETMAENPAAEEGERLAGDPVSEARQRIEGRSRRQTSIAWALSRVGYVILAAVLLGGGALIASGEWNPLVGATTTTTTLATTPTTIPPAATTTTTTQATTTTTTLPATTTTVPATTTTTQASTTTTAAPRSIEVVGVCQWNGWYQYRLENQTGGEMTAELVEHVDGAEHNTEATIPEGSWRVWSQAAELAVIEAGDTVEPTRAGAGPCDEPTPAEVFVDVRNGNGVALQAARYATRIEAAGYEAEASNWANYDVVTTSIGVPVELASHAENLVVRVFGEVDIAENDTFTVVLGADAPTIR